MRKWKAPSNSGLGGEAHAMRWYLPVSLCLIAMVCFAVWFLRVHYLYETMDYQHIVSEDGVWDLTGFDFEEGFARANGSVAYFPGVLLTPEEFEARSGEAFIGETDENPVNTARLRLLMPDDATYMIAMNSMDFSERIYINGQWRQDVGTPGLTAEASTPGYAYLYFEVQPQNGVIEIVRQSANFVHRENSNSSGIRVGAPEVIRRHLALETDLVGLTMGLFLALVLAHGMLFLILPGYRANLYFALLCLTWCARTGVVGVKVLGAWFPSLSWYAMFRLEYLATPLAALLILLILRQVFPALLPGWLTRGAVALFGLYAMCCLFVPTVPLSYSMVGFEIAYILVIAAIIAALAVKLPGMIREGAMRPERWVMLAGLAFFMLAAIHDALYYNGIHLFGIGFVVTDLAMLVFALFAMAAMFYATMRQVREAQLEADTLRRLNQIKGDALRNLSHELQMPITVISGYAQLTQRMMTDETVDRPAIHENMRITDSEAGRMLRLVTQLLDAAALESGTFALRRHPVDVAALLTEIARQHFPVMDGGGNTVELNIAPNLPIISGDGERIKQVVLNLLSNAVQHTENGVITLAARVSDEGGVAVSVTDTGGGISAALLPVLFKQYLGGSATRNGVGLHVAAQIIQAHGGAIDVQSEEGKGTTVRFLLPAKSRKGAT